MLKNYLITLLAVLVGGIEHCHLSVLVHLPICLLAVYMGLPALFTSERQMKVGSQVTQKNAKTCQPISQSV